MWQNSLDRYVQGTSLIHRLDPRLKLLATVAFVVAVSSTPPQAWPVLAMLALLPLAAIRLAGIPWSVALRRSAIALPFAGMVALSLPFTQAGEALWTWNVFGLSLTVTDEGVLHFLTVLAKAWLAVLLNGLLVATTRFPDLLSGLRALRVPAILTATISFMVRYLFVLVEEAMRLQTAREARSVGAGRSVWWRAQVLGRMIGSLFIRSYERSERIYAAMLARGYAGELRSLTRLSWQRRDSWAGLVWALALTSAILVGRTIVG